MTPSKHRRLLNRLNATRADMTEVRASLSDERVGLTGYEDYYEITSDGEVYSKRLNRFVKHKFGDRGSVYIEFQIHGQAIQLGIGKAVAESYLTQDQIHAILRALPEEVEKLEDLRRLDIIASLAKQYNVLSTAIFYVLWNELQGRQSRKLDKRS